MVNDNSKIKITVDKSHLFTLGEKMYRESIEFIRELVNNAYDADATRVFVMILDNKITVEDDGNGMNIKGMEQFFTIGSEEKKVRNVSPRFGRKRIGQFGIGKFSALSLTNQFIIQSVKGKFKYSVIFNRAQWQSSDSWELPIKTELASPLDKEGTKIILNKLTKNISISEVEKYLKQSVPLRAKKFNVFLNNKKITAKTVAGKIIPINIKTLYGSLDGEIIIALNPRDVSEPGVECRVKQVFIKRELFDIEKKHLQGVSRITGHINADFLPLISSRSDFIIDNPEYKLFYQLMRAELDKVLQELKKQSDTKNLQKITKELQEIMKQVRDALILNPDFTPKGKAVTRLKKEGKRKIATAGISIKNPDALDAENIKHEEKPADAKLVPAKAGNENEQKREEKQEKPKQDIKPLAMKRIRLQKLGISCGIVSLGEKGPEVIRQGNAVYINQDHSLYKKLYKKRDVFHIHLLRLLTQEIVLMKKKNMTSQEAFSWQSKLLKDALCK
ncbi:MAG: ATP-binding protein [Patescibacteria group bacterium]|nr:ATP-binding protein [Patescibacteria group bacterium]